MHRCQTFAQVGTSTRTILEEAFDLRSATEHLHPWDHSLRSHAANVREDVALQRTRQLEALACFAYSRILENGAIREHFRNEAEQSNFWSQINDVSRRAAWGQQFDLASVALVQNYDQWGRATTYGVGMFPYRVVERTFLTPSSALQRTDTGTVSDRPASARRRFQHP